MSAEEYVPSEDEMRKAYVWLSAGDNEGAREQATEDFNRGLARVRRDAKAEALREAADHIEDVVANARPEQAFTEHVLMEHGGPGYLRELAAEYEEEK